MTEEEIQKYVTFFEEQLDKKVLPISSVSGRNIDILKNLLFKSLIAKNKLGQKYGREKLLI